MRRIPPIAFAVLALAAGGCRQGKVTLGISDSTFVATIAQLHSISADTALDSASRASARAAVLQREGLTADSLERAARAMASDPQHALAVWTAIQQHVRKTPATRTP